MRCLSTHSRWLLGAWRSLPFERQLGRDTDSERSLAEIFQKIYGFGMRRSSPFEQRAHQVRLFCLFSTPALPNAEATVSKIAGERVVVVRTPGETRSGPVPGVPLDNSF